MKRIGMVAVVTIAMFACLLLCTPALADYNFDGFPVETRVSGTVNGGVFIDYEPWAGTTTLTGNFDVPDGDVKWARLYTGIWGGTEDYEGWVNVTFNGVYDRNGLGPIHLQGESDTNPNVWCTTHGKYWMFYNVTDLVNSGEVNTATTTKINATVGSFDGRVYGIVLVVVYEGGDKPKDIQYWINDGNDALHYAYATWPPVAHDTGTTYFNGTVNTDTVTKANLTMVHLTGYEPVCDSCLKFNDNALNTSMVDSNTFELNSWDVTDYVASAGNNVWYSRGDDPYINVANAILVLEREAVEKPTVTISTDKYEYTAGETMLINITFANSLEIWQPAHFLWRLDLPDYDLHYWITEKEIYLPPESEKTITIPMGLPKWGVSFNATWYVTLLNTTIPEIISEDTADWRYVAETGMGNSERRSKAQAEEIAKEMVKILDNKWEKEDIITMY